MTRDERLTRLETAVQNLTSRLQLFAEQVVEQNLRVRFVMSAIQMTRPAHGGIIDPTTNQPKLERTDLFVQYMTGGRDLLLAQLEQEMKDVHAAMAQMKGEEATDGEGTPVTEGEGSAAGSDAEGQHAGDHEPAADSPGAERADGRSSLLGFPNLARSAKG